MHWLKTYVSSTRLSYSRGLFKAVILVNVYTDAVLLPTFADVFKYFFGILGLRGTPRAVGGTPLPLLCPKGVFLMRLWPPRVALEQSLGSLWACFSDSLGHFPSAWWTWTFLQAVGQPFGGQRVSN